MSYRQPHAKQRSKREAHDGDEPEDKLLARVRKLAELMANHVIRDVDGDILKQRGSNGEVRVLEHERQTEHDDAPASRCEPRT